MQMPQVVQAALELPHLLLDHLSLTLVVVAVVVNKAMAQAPKQAVLVARAEVVLAVQVERFL